MWHFAVLGFFCTRGRSCPTTLMRTQRRETFQTRTVLMRWRTTASWWMEMYVPLLVCSSVSCRPLLQAADAMCLCVFPAGVSELSLTVSYNAILAVCFSLCLSAWLFLLISCSSLFPFVLSSPTVAHFCQSGRYCIQSSSSTSHKPHPVICHTLSFHLMGKHCTTN